MDSIKSYLKGHEGLARVVRRLGRFRFALKARRVREEGVRLRDDPVNVLRFVLLDPETHSYTYDLDNEVELADYLAAVTQAPRERIAGYLAEARADPELNQRVSARVRWRIDSKRRLPLGNRLLWYGLVRAVKPRTVVETGVHDGLGSLVVLRALERNAAEGAAGELISLDFDPDAGWLVPEGLRDRWQLVVGAIEESLRPALEGREVGVFIHESDHNEELQRFEFGQALEHAADDLYVIDSGGAELPVLRSACEARGGDHSVFAERPRRHFYRPVGTAVAVFRGARDGGGQADPGGGRGAAATPRR